MSSATMLSPRSRHDGRPTLARPAPARTTNARPAVPRTSVAQLRLTRRGRVVLLAITLLAVATLAILLARPVLADPVQSGPGQIGPEQIGPGQSGPESSGAGTSTVLVGPGDSLWDIAEAAVPDRDPRAVVHEIRLLNDLADAGIAVGAELVVPLS